MHLSNLRNIRLLVLLLLLGSTPAMAQWKSYKIGVKGDTLNCVDQKDRQQGPWIIRQDAVRGDRGFEEEGYFKDGFRTGFWRRYSLEGDLMAVEHYRWGMKDGKQVYFYLDGRPSREEYWRAVDPQSPYDTVPVRDLRDPNKIIRYEVVKVEPSARKHGKWVFYDERTGRVDGTEEWIMGKLKVEEDELAPIAVSESNSGDNGTAAGNPEKKAAPPKEKSKPKEVLEFEKKHKGKNRKYDVRTGETGG